MGVARPREMGLIDLNAVRLRKAWFKLRANLFDAMAWTMNNRKEVNVD